MLGWSCYTYINIMLKNSISGGHIIKQRGAIMKRNHYMKPLGGKTNGTQCHVGTLAAHKPSSAWKVHIMGIKLSLGRLGRSCSLSMFS